MPVRPAIGSQPQCAQGWPQQQIGSYRSVSAHQAQKGRSTLVNTRKVFGQPLSQGSTDGLLYTCQLFFYCIHCTAICSAITEISFESTRFCMASSQREGSRPRRS